MPATFGTALRRLRLAKGLGVRELARAVGVSHVSILNMEKGKIDCSLTTLGKLADALNCSLDELCGRQAPAS